MLKVSVVTPSRTVILDGLATSTLSLRTEIGKSAGAGPVNWIVPTDLDPPTTVDGETLTLLTVGAMMMKRSLRVISPLLAVTVTVV
jgi:hypothetical protein